MHFSFILSRCTQITVAVLKDHNFILQFLFHFGLALLKGNYIYGPEWTSTYFFWVILQSLIKHGLLHFRSSGCFMSKFHSPEFNMSVTSREE